MAKTAVYFEFKDFTSFFVMDMPTFAMVRMVQDFIEGDEQGPLSLKTADDSYLLLPAKAVARGVWKFSLYEGEPTDTPQEKLPYHPFYHHGVNNDAA